MRPREDAPVRELRKAPDAVGIGRRKADRGQAGMPFAYRFHRREVSRRVVCDETNGRESVENALIQPVSVEDLAVLLQIPVDQLAGALLSLELKEFVKRLPGQQYAINY